MEHLSNIKYYQKGNYLLFGDASERNGEIVGEIDDQEWMDIIIGTLNTAIAINDNSETITKHIDSGKR
jgi:hypothetical protein